MLGKEDLTAIVLGKHGAVIETHANRRDVSIECPRRSHELAAVSFTPELGVWNRARVTVREPEVQSRARCMVELIGRDVVPHLVTTVVSKPQLLGLRMPVEPHRVSNSVGKNFQPTPVGIHPKNGPIALIVPLTNVARKPDRDI